MRREPFALSGMFVAHIQSAPRASFAMNALVPPPPVVVSVLLKVAWPVNRPTTYTLPSASTTCFGDVASPSPTFEEIGQPQPSTSVVNVSVAPMVGRPELVNELFATSRK